jgi:hypothetical protein
VTAVDTENGTSKWVYEVNTTDSDNRSSDNRSNDNRGNDNRGNDNCYISGLQANGNILAFRYDVPGVAHGLIALDLST